MAEDQFEKLAGLIKQTAEETREDLSKSAAVGSTRSMGESKA
jgi:hypothetical protein